MNEDIFDGYGVEVELADPECFHKCRETLTRIGVASRHEKKLFQSCHILHKRGRYIVVHFKELFELDGRDSDFDDEDRARRDRIATLLEEWGLVKIVDPTKLGPLAAMSTVKVIHHSEKAEWTLQPKHSLGTPKCKREEA